MQGLERSLFKNVVVIMFLTLLFVCFVLYPRSGLSPCLSYHHALYEHLFYIYYIEKCILLPCLCLSSNDAWLITCRVLQVTAALLLPGLRHQHRSVLANFPVSFCKLIKGRRYLYHGCCTCWWLEETSLGKF
jgi:hypothetical protein